MVTIMEVFTTDLDHNLIVNMIKTRIKQKQQNNINSKLNVFDYLKSQEAKDLMDEIEDANNDTDNDKLPFL